ncbi:putative proton conductor component of motor [Actinoplanes missouriensis 431]|uniref:Putative proton conductor component of motor n=1 Tax=Actinoplanes missouriensis (strain ATCC 14538 / DSM 43046 / CBS 188.64 / JCM 3121 / NBRC 102363 / NCIMB 12654 / NRRL B-3342 / UNCC 431) TaxID=512565 RepID=I0HIM7_ACTM4|nr:flagellar motor protein [Actinoplanes missouriensis]BAL92864.1 putative proton conductor component of motor [Actinoplanes missouriensis 431]
MDLATIIGVVAGLVIVFVVQMLEGGNAASIILLPSMLLVFGGGFAAAMAGGVMKDASGVVGSLKKAFTTKVTPPTQLLDSVVKLAERARREGLLALEDAVKTVEHPFLKRGLQLAIDGTDPDELHDILHAEVAAKKKADKAGMKFFENMGGYAPTIGIIGTVMGLVHVLENLDNPDTLGHSIAAAFVATLWGVLSANILWLPIAARLGRLSAVEAEEMELVIDGVLAIQAGSNPRLVAQKLRSLLPPDEMKKAEAAASTKKAA